MGFLLYRFLNSEEQTATAKDMMAAQRVPPDQSVSSEDSRVLSLEDEDGFENIDEKVVKSMNEDPKSGNPRTIAQRKPETSIEKISHRVRNLDYDKHIRNAKERLQEGAIAGLKLADEGVARASRTLSEYRDSVVAAQEIKRVRKDGDGRPDPLSCDYVGGAGFDGTLPEDVVECLEPSSRVQAQQSNRLNRPPSPSSLAIAMIAERTEELPRSRSRSHSHNPKPNPPLFKSTKTSDHVEKLPNTSRPIGPKNQIKTQSAFKSATISQRVDESHAGVRDVSDSGEYTDDGPKRMKSIRAVQAQGERRNRNGRSAERLEIDTSETSHQAHQGPQGKKEKGDGGNGVMVNVPL